MITVEEHLARILAATTPVPPRVVPLGEAHGHVLAADVVASVAVPPFDNSAMDGYAVHASDVAHATDASPVRLRVTDDVPAGLTRPVHVEPGTAVRIMTGAPMPGGADAVVPVELTDQPPGPGTASIVPETVAIHETVPTGRHIRRAAEDVKPGDIVLRAGTRLQGRHLSAAASVGHGAVPVHALRVGVLASGAELVAPGSALEYGQIPDSNSTLVAGLVREAGAVPVMLGPVDDDPQALRELLTAHVGALDALVTTGGVSAGAYDVLKELFASTTSRALGEVTFTKVAMQPGKPQGFGLLKTADGARKVPVFTLPGNPVSVFVSFHVFVAPAMARLRGTPPPAEPIKAIAATGWRGARSRMQFMPVSIDGAADPIRVRPAAAGGSGSHLVASLAGADGLAIVPAAVDQVREGDVVRVMMVP